MHWDDQKHLFVEESFFTLLAQGGMIILFDVEKSGSCPGPTFGSKFC